MYQSPIIKQLNTGFGLRGRFFFLTYRVHETIFIIRLEFDPATVGPGTRLVYTWLVLQHQTLFSVIYSLVKSFYYFLSWCHLTKQFILPFLVTKLLYNSRWPIDKHGVNINFSPAIQNRRKEISIQSKT